MAEYAWLITKDHLFDGATNQTANPEWQMPDEAGTTGPSDATPEQLAALADNQGHVFRMYDDDGILYYSGRMVGDPSEYSDGPLRDFGGPNAGAVLIKWAGHPEWDSEY